MISIVIDIYLYDRFLYIALRTSFIMFLFLLDVRYMPEALILCVSDRLLESWIITLLLLDFQSLITHTQCQLLKIAYVELSETRCV